MANHIFFIAFAGPAPGREIERLNAAVPGMVIAADTIDVGSLSTHTWTATSSAAWVDEEGRR